jgi:polar amino acid transport system ATP-binding protein
VTLALNLENKVKTKEFKKNYVGNNKKQSVKNFINKLNEQTYSDALKILKDLGLEDKINNYPFQLSGGEQQRVAIARALILNPKILCFDEPTSALDPGLTGEVVKVINELKKQNHTMMIITHELDFAYQVADKIIVIEGGKIIEEKEVIR